MNIKTSMLFACLFSTFCWAKTPLVLLSIDGFAQRYLQQYQPHTLMSLSKQGTSAQALLPVYPSKTFPNHLSIITGQYPINHGIVHNTFYHRDLDKIYQVGKSDAGWLTAQPLWYINERQGNKSAIYFWPESETPIANKTASYYIPYRHFTPNKKRFAQILAWLRLPATERPNFIAGYFASIDDAGHNFGENSPQLIDAINQLDNLLGEFVKSIKEEFDERVNLIIVSDHGMMRVNKHHRIKWQQNMVNGVTAVNGITQLYLYSDNKENLQQSIRLFENANNKHRESKYQIYQHPNYPSHWHLNSESAVVPDVIIEASPSYVFSQNEQELSPGNHGYDPKLQRDLDGIFIATGPSFYNNKSIAAFENIHVLPIMTRALGLSDEVCIDGNYQLAEQVVIKNVVK